MTAVLPRIRLHVSDVTRYLNGEDGERIKSLGGKISQVSIFDETRHIHCAEIEASYELRHLYLISSELPASEYLRNELSELLIACEADGDDCEYVHVRSVNLEKCKLLNELTEAEWSEYLEDADNEDEAHNKMMADMLEKYNANHPI